MYTTTLPPNPVDQYDLSDLNVPENPEGGFVNAMARGVDSSQMALYGFAKAVGDLTGVDLVSKWADKGIEYNLRQILENPPKVHSWDDTETLADYANYILETIGEQVPQLLVDIPLVLASIPSSGGVGGAAAVGARRTALAAIGKAAKRVLGETAYTGFRKHARKALVANMYTQAAGETQLELEAEGIDSPSSALAAGIPKAMLDIWGAERLVGVARTLNVAPRDLLQVSGRAIKEAGIGFLSEGFTEAAQTAIDKIVVNAQAGEDYDLFSDANIREIKEAGIKGAIVGSVFSGARGTFEQYMDYRDQIRNDQDVESFAAASEIMDNAITPPTSTPTTTMAPETTHQATQSYEAAQTGLSEIAVAQRNEAQAAGATSIEEMTNAVEQASLRDQDLDVSLTPPAPEAPAPETQAPVQDTPPLYPTYDGLGDRVSPKDLTFDDPMPETQTQVDAQAKAVAEGRKPAMEITRGSPPPTPGILPPDATVMETQNGHLVTMDHSLAEQFGEFGGSQAAIGSILYGNPEGKKATDGTVTIGRDSDGEVVYEEHTSKKRLATSLSNARQVAGEGGSVQISDAVSAVVERADARLQEALDKFAKSKQRDGMHPLQIEALTTQILTEYQTLEPEQRMQLAKGDVYRGLQEIYGQARPEIVDDRASINSDISDVDDNSDDIETFETEPDQYDDFTAQRDSVTLSESTGEVIIPSSAVRYEPKHQRTPLTLGEIDNRFDSEQEAQDYANRLSDADKNTKYEITPEQIGENDKPFFQVISNAAPISPDGYREPTPTLPDLQNMNAFETPKDAKEHAAELNKTAPKGVTYQLVERAQWDKTAKQKLISPRRKYDEDGHITYQIERVEDTSSPEGDPRVTNENGRIIGRVESDYTDDALNAAYESGLSRRQKMGAMRNKIAKLKREKKPTSKLEAELKNLEDSMITIRNENTGEIIEASAYDLTSGGKTLLQAEQTSKRDKIDNHFHVDGFLRMMASLQNTGWYVLSRKGEPMTTFPRKLIVHYGKDPTVNPVRVSDVYKAKPSRIIEKGVQNRDFGGRRKRVTKAPFDDEPMALHFEMYLRKNDIALNGDAIQHAMDAYYAFFDAEKKYAKAVDDRAAYEKAQAALPEKERDGYPGNKPKRRKVAAPKRDESSVLEQYLKAVQKLIEKAMRGEKVQNTAAANLFFRMRKNAEEKGIPMIELPAFISIFRTTLHTWVGDLRGYLAEPEQSDLKHVRSEGRLVPTQLKKGGSVTMQPDTRGSGEQDTDKIEVQAQEAELDSAHREEEFGYDGRRQADRGASKRTPLASPIVEVGDINTKIRILASETYGPTHANNLAQFAAEIQKELGLGFPIDIGYSTREDIDALYLSGVIDNSMREEIHKQNKKYKAAFIPVRGKALILLKPNIGKDKTLGPIEEMYWQLGHELGHAVKYFSYANVPNRMRGTLNKAFAADREGVKRYQQEDGFEEWFADKIAASVAERLAKKQVREKQGDSGSLNNRRMKNLFDSIGDKFIKLYQKMREWASKNNNTRFIPNKEFSRFMEYGIKKKVFRNANTFGEERFYYMDNSAGITPTQDSRSRWQRYGDELLGPSRTLAKGQNKIKRPWITGGVELHHIDKELGDTFARKPGTTLEGKRDIIPQTGIQWAKWKAGIERIFKKHSTAKMAVGLKQLSSQLPTDQLNAAAKDVRAYLNEFHKKELSKIPDIGFIEDYYFRNYSKPDIRSRRSEFVDMLKRHFARTGKLNSDVEQTVASELITSKILEDPVTLDDLQGLTEEQAKHVKEILDDMGSLKASDDTVKPGEGTLRLDRKLNDPELSKELTEGGFINKNPMGELFSYLLQSVRRVQFETAFGGYKEWTDQDGNQQRKWNADLQLKMKIAQQRALYDNHLREKGYIEETSEVKTMPSTGHIMFRNVGGPWVTVAPKPGEMTPYQADRVVTIIKGFYGQNGQKMDPKLRSMQSSVMAMTNWITLSLSGVATLVESANILAGVRNFGDLDIAWKAIKGMFENRAEMIEAYEDLGMAEHNAAAQALSEVFGYENLNAFAETSNRWLFKLNGNEFLVKMFRTVSIHMGMQFFTRHAKRAKEGNAQSKRYLDEFGVTADEVQTWDALGRPILKIEKVGIDPDFEVKDKMFDALHRWTDSVVARPNRTERPVYGNDPRYAMLMHLKPFSFHLHYNVFSRIMTESKTRWGEDKGDALMYMGSVAAIFFAMAAMANELREEIQYSLFGEYRPSDHMSGGEYVSHLLMNRIGLGSHITPWSDALFNTHDQSLGMFGLVPAVSVADNALNEPDLFSASLKITPIVAQNYGMQKYLKKQWYGEDPAPRKQTKDQRREDRLKRVLERG